MSTSVQIGKISDIPRQGSRVIENDGHRLAVFRTVDDELFAVEDRCPHKGGPLSQGIVHGRSVTCPLHQWVMKLEDGHAVLPDVGCVRTYPVSVVDDTVHVKV